MLSTSPLQGGHVEFPRHLTSPLPVPSGDQKRCAGILERVGGLANRASAHRPPQSGSAAIGYPSASPRCGLIFVSMGWRRANPILARSREPAQAAARRRADRVAGLGYLSISKGRTGPDLVAGRSRRPDVPTSCVPDHPLAAGRGCSGSARCQFSRMRPSVWACFTQRMPLEITLCTIGS